MILAAAVAPAGGADEPIILTPQFTLQDAPEVTPTDHGAPGLCLSVDWSVTAAGPTPGHDALYLFPINPSPRPEIKSDMPMMVVVDLANGKIKEFYENTPIQLKQESAPGLAEGLPANFAVNWCWGRPLCGARAPDGRLFLGMNRQKGAHGKYALVVYDPHVNTFQELAACDAQPTGLIFVGDTPWLLTGDGVLYTYDELLGLDDVARMGKRAGATFQQGLLADDRKFFYTTCGPFPWRLQALRVNGEKIQVTPLLADLVIERIRLHADAAAPWCEAVVGKDGHFVVKCFELRDGRAVPREGPPDPQVLAAKRGYELEFDPDRRPMQVAVRRSGQAWQKYPLVFERAGWDAIKTMRGGPNGKYLYGANWPAAWIWRFDPQTDRFQILGSHYVFYEMQPWQDELWVTGYWGIKLLRWRPEEPWTFDYDRHYYKKKYAGHTSPWGDKDVSNPRLVCKFRYLKQLMVRRPGGMVITDDGCAWVGGRTPPFETFMARFGGAVNWYDPATETIGQIRDPFLHHSVLDVCRAGKSHVAAVATQRYNSPLEPLPENFSPGKFVLIDIRTRQAALDCSPLDAPLFYAEEGEPGRVVVYGSPGKYAGDGVQGALFIFDVAQMKVTHVIRLSVRVVWTEYDNAQRFERGPDRRIYFYGRNDQGVVLCRVDSVSGKVEPVLRGHNITDVASYVNKGAPFTFFGDRVYFGCGQLVSLPLKTVIGEMPSSAGGKP